MKKQEEELDSDERHFKIEEDHKKAQISAIRVDTLSKYLNMGFPVKDALKLSGIEMNESEIKSLETSRKNRKSKK